MTRTAMGLRDKARESQNKATRRCSLHTPGSAYSGAWMDVLTRQITQPEIPQIHRRRRA